METLHEVTGQRHTGPTCYVEPGTTSLCGLMVGVGMSSAIALSGKTNVYEATNRVPKDPCGAPCWTEYLYGMAELEYSRELEYSPRHQHLVLLPSLATLEYPLSGTWRFLDA